MSDLIPLDTSGQAVCKTETIGQHTPLRVALRCRRLEWLYALVHMKLGAELQYVAAFRCPAHALGLRRVLLGP
eukprot:CAMPEP_0119368390 /NCGR_PEP_ID=MMETSP1334-20130426/15051_1 /TAXON_ID=127549 /ORGANISM="Calcidiscus leptoporus, Strain RCC1130" /LENGTH=72 /DNA_ID=CAMNT_0007385015 /DNA_START=71 /DNA_END=289 /DNA_ORIENTATION=+